MAWGAGVPPVPDCVEGELWLRMASAQSRMVAGTRWRRGRPLAKALRRGRELRLVAGGYFGAALGGLGEVCGVVARVGGVKVG